MLVPRQKSEKARIEIIPMIDVIFFLLVFFMISTLSMTINRGLPVNLPTATTAQKDVREHFNLTLTRDGGLFLNKELIAPQELEPRVKAGLAAEPELLVIINADGEVPHRAVVEVMDALQVAGVSRLAIAVQAGGMAPP